MTGEQIGHYRIVSQLGSGGMGVVYEAEDLRLGRRVALKFLPEGVSIAEDAAERFEREARTLASLSHPNICTVHDIGTHGNRRFIVMELVDGESLRSRIHGHPLEQARGEETDGRTDLFALGLVLYEMATGRQAFGGQTTAVVFDAILNRQPADPRTLNPSLPDVEGSIAPLGSAYVIAIGVHNCEMGETLAQEQVQAGSNLGRAGTNDRDLAREHATTAFELGDRVSEYERLYITWLHARQVLDDHQKAKDTLELMIAAYPRDFSARNNLGIYYIGRGELEPALEQFREASDIAPGEPLPLFERRVRAALHEPPPRGRAVHRTGTGHP